MLYTLSQAHYGAEALQSIVAELSEDDVLVLWQNGVLQAVRYPDLFRNVHHCVVLENDLNARGLTTALPTISLDELVHLSERYTPHIGL